MKFNHFKEREYQRQTHFIVSNALKDILAADGEPIPDDEFEYTHVPHRLSRAIKKTPPLDAYSYCERQQAVGWEFYRDFTFVDFSLCQKDAVIDEDDPVLSWYGAQQYLCQMMASNFDNEQGHWASVQMNKILRDFSDADIFIQLNEIPESDRHFTMDVVNEHGLPSARITLILRSNAWIFAEKCKKRLQKATERLNVLLEKKHHEKLRLKEENAYKEGVTSLFNEGELKVLHDCRNKIDHEKELMIASILTGNVRVIGNKAHFPGTKSAKLLKTIELQEVPPIFKEGNKIVEVGKVTTDDIYDAILYMNTTVSPFEDHESRAEFSLIQNEMTLDNFLWAKVLYKPTPRAQLHFKNNFLHPHDKILSWTTGHKIEDTWEQANVLIRLGLDMVPPKRAIVDRIRRNLQHALDQNPTKKKLNAVVSSIDRAKRQRVVYDKYDMSCCIKFCYQYCQYCHVTGHEYGECPEFDYDD